MWLHSLTPFVACPWTTCTGMPPTPSCSGRRARGTQQVRSSTKLLHRLSFRVTAPLQCRMEKYKQQNGVEEHERQNVPQRHSEVRLPAAAPSPRRRPQPGPARIRDSDPSRSRLKPEDRQRTQIMIRSGTWGIESSVGVTMTWTRSLSAGLTVTVIMTVTHPGRESEQAFRLWPRLRLRVGGLGLAVTAS